MPSNLHSASPAGNQRKVLDDISNVSQLRQVGEHVTPKKRRLDFTDNEKDRIDNLGISANLEKRTPMKLHISSANKKSLTPSSQLREQPKKIEKFANVEGTPTSTKLDGTAKPFPEMNNHQFYECSPSRTRTTTNCDNNATFRADERFMETQQQSNNDEASSTSSQFGRASNIIHNMRIKFNVKDIASTPKPSVLYTEVPLVKAKLNDWRAKYGTKSPR